MAKKREEEVKDLKVESETVKAESNENLLRKDSGHINLEEK